MNVLFTSANHPITKFCEEKSRFKILAPEIDFSQIAEVLGTFKRSKIAAVIHIDTIGAKGDWAKRSILYKNLQTCCSAYRVPKLIVVSDELKWLSSGENDKITTLLQFPVLYGAGVPQKDNYIMTAVFKAMRGADMSIEADKVFSALYIEDALRVLGLMLKRDTPKGAYCVSPPDPATKIGVIKALKYASNKLLPYEVKSRVTAPDEVLDGSSFAEAFPDFKFIGLKSGIGRTYKALTEG